MRNVVVWLAAFGLLAGVPVAAHADVPGVMNVQGILTDTAGHPKSPGWYVFTFKIFDAETGGNLKWEEQQTVNVKARSLWNASLGQANPLDESVFIDPPRWLEVTVNDGVNPPEILTRVQLQTGPYTFRAASSQVADSVRNGGGGGWADDGTVVRLVTETDSVGIGTTSPTANLHVVGTLYVSEKGNFGPNNANPGSYAFVAGSADTAGGHYSTVGGGQMNVAAATLSTIGGGNMNRVSNEYGTIGGGFENNITGFGGTVAGGRDNHANSRYATVGGGYHNCATGAFSVVAGGGGESIADSNAATGDYSAVAGGRSNNADGDYSLAAGRRAKADHDGAFVWADGTDADFASTAANQFLIRASGNVGIGTNNPSSPLEVAGTVHSSSGGFKFPDGTVQATAASSGGWVHDGRIVFDGDGPTSWTDLDLSSYVGSGHALVMLSVKSGAGGDIGDTRFRLNGDPEVGIDNFSAAGWGCSAGSIGRGRIAYMVIETDENGVVEWKVQGMLGWLECTAKLVGYMK